MDEPAQVARLILAMPHRDSEQSDTGCNPRVSAIPRSSAGFFASPAEAQNAPNFIKRKCQR